VHLPDPQGDVTRNIRLLPGVTFVEANRWTDNILILFQPHRTKAAVIVAWLRSGTSSPVPEAVPELIADRTPSTVSVPSAAKPVEYATGLRRRVYRLLGWGSVGMAVVGFLVPGIPGAPFVLIAGYFFSRSSPEAHAWLLHSRWFGPLLRTWEQQRGVRKSTKYTALGLILAVVVIVSLAGLPAVVVGLVWVLLIIGMILVLLLPEAASAPPALTPQLA
jgi:uncharacterized membrane protein YbaN (DUF454 family)